MIATFSLSHIRAVPHGSYKVTFKLLEQEPVLRSTFQELLEEQNRRVVGFTDDGKTLRLYEGSTLFTHFRGRGRIDPLTSLRVLMVHWFAMSLFEGQVSYANA